LKDSFIKRLSVTLIQILKQPLHQRRK